METLVDIQHWLYRGIGEGLGNVAGGDYRAVLVAMAAAIVFGAVHALMPGHGKIVLISYHLGQPSRPRTAFANGAILALTHVGLAVALVLAGYAVISRAFAYGGRTPQFEAPSGGCSSSSSAPTCFGLRLPIAMTPPPKVDPLRSRRA